MRHYDWKGSGGLARVDKPEVIPTADGRGSIPIGTGVQPNDYDTGNNFHVSAPVVNQGFSSNRVMLANNQEAQAMKNEVKRGDRVATLMPGTGAK